MKAFFVFPIFILMNVVAVIAQSIVIQAPANGAIVNPASTITVKIARPVLLATTTEVAIIIGFQSCAFLTGCAAPTSTLGNVVLDTITNFAPTVHTGDPLGAAPYQNFTVTLPLLPLLGTVQLTFAHFILAGAPKQAVLEFLNVNLTVTIL